MDLFTANAAQSLNAQNARRAAQQLEYRRVASERSAERAVADAGTVPVAAPTPVPVAAPTPVPVAPKRRQGFSFPAILRSRPHTAQ